MESSVTFEDIVESNSSNECNIRRFKITSSECHVPDSGDDEGENVDVGPVKMVKKRLQQMSTSESDGDSPSKTTNKSDDESRLLKSDQNNRSNKNNNGSFMNCVKKRIQKFSVSESDNDKEYEGNVCDLKTNSSDSDEGLHFETKKQKFRTKIAHHSDSGSSADEALKNEQQQLRMKNKRNKLKEKFKSLVKSRLNESNTEKVGFHSGSETGGDNIKYADNSEQSNHDETSIERIKQIIKDKTTSYKNTICDPDTSDEENHSSTKSIPQKKQGRKSAKLTSPKPIRITAKQALENMKKIKSESNRMLREKEVTLPYHRPKALNLKDIISRRKPAVSSDGKTLPIKMNEEQLKQYAKILEERQKEMMELCKSDTDEDPEENEPEKKDESTHLSDYHKISECVGKKEGPKLNVNENLEDDMEISSNTVHSSVETGGKIPDNVEQDNTSENSAGIESGAKEVDNTVNLVSDMILNDAEDDNNSVVKVSETANHSMNSSTSNAEMSLVYNDSIEETSNENTVAISNNETDNITCEKSKEIDVKQATKLDSQRVSLHYDTEKTEIDTENMELKENEPHPSTSKDLSDVAIDEVCRDNDFSDDDMINLDEIDNLIENAHILKDNNDATYANSPMLINDTNISNLKPKLTGAPGMVIDLDGTDTLAQKKVTGLELLKERFTYFAKLKTPEELEREKEKRLKPGAQHLKLRHELEEKMAEQRSLEWAKRLDEEKKQQMEMNAIRGDESDDEIEKMEAKLDEQETLNKESSESEESDEEMLEIKDKPRKRNPMIDDEAEESDVEECVGEHNKEEEQIENDEVEEDDAEENNDEESEESSEESSEEETEVRAKKGRILKAFEDSDEEDDIPKNIGQAETKDQITENKIHFESQVILESQDEDLQLAQRHKSLSGDLFTSQESIAKLQTNCGGPNEEPDIGTQTFSILNERTTTMSMDLDEPEKLNVISETQPNDDSSLDAVIGMCSGTFTQNLVDSQVPSTGLLAGNKFSVISKTQKNGEPNLEEVVGMCSGSFSQNLVTTQTPAESQPIGEDILNLCTGKFYDNKFITQNSDVKNIDESQISATAKENGTPTENKIQDDNLKSILEELNDPEFEELKPKKYFMDNPKDESSTQFKKKFIIDSDDETNNETSDVKQKKKIKKKKLEKRALQISDDEEDECEEEFEDGEEVQDYTSDVEDADRLVEYDSEENEVEVKPQKEKQKRKMAEFFEQEAELTSEDEWLGSGDEDEAGLDRMEREAGDDDAFHQGALQAELGQIHMRDVLEQDKREVRLLQELLFEDGDLGEGHRQRKFRWRNADGEEEDGGVPDELADTQEEEMESEEQWRKQRHERELFLRQMQNKDEDEVNMSITKTTIIKADLCSLSEASHISVNIDSPVVEHKSSKDIPSPKRAFTVFQQSYHGSLLSRGGRALARLAALAAPLTDDVPAPPRSKRNFVFTARDHDDSDNKVTKRKADTNVGTPRLVKKMKTEEMKKDKLFPYAEENVKQYLENNWEDERVKGAVTALRKLALEDQEKNVEGVVAIPAEDASKEEQIEGLVNNVKWQMSADRKAGPLKQLQGLIWKQGYDSGDIKGHVYDDVLPALEQWRATEGQKVYIYSSGSVDAQKLLFEQSLAGDMLPLIDGHFDTAVGAKQEAASYAAIVEKIGCKPEEILFLTDIVKEAEAARSSGLHAALVSRAGNAPLAADAAAAFPVLHSLAQLLSNKRKTDPQDEQPAKIAKTDSEEDIKPVEAEVSKAPAVIVAADPENTEQMEVEETAPVEQLATVEQTATTNGDQKIQDSPVEKAVVEEITDSNDIADIPVITVEPVVVEESDKTDEIETEKMETDVTETTPPGKVETEVKASEIITEIEEITDKNPLPEAAEVVDDIVPVVEEPTAVEEDMEVLQNVGESLEKECEEILSKVQDVTNLDNIPVKPLLNPIAEEIMETENTDSNDIVDRILDTELELGMKQCDDIDLNNVAELTETNTRDSDKTEQIEAVAANNVPEDKIVAEAEVKKTTETMEESTVTEAITESKAVEVDIKETPEESKETPKVSEAAPEGSTGTPEESKEAVVKTRNVSEAQAATDKGEEKETEAKENDKPSESNAEEAKVNGSMTNGDSETVNLNGDAKNEELNSRLSVENGKEVNGSNGDAKETEEKGQGDAKEVEVPEIKVKSVPVDEQRTDPIEQPTEA
ncbi:claspin-like [Plodia interpunctella]|uniref:claspin-like n=1 Tax=Plodia interpunctella TaxID=58824 RepID=UPI002367B442|nr:claspin-like [Plodia interpunctella]